MDQPKGVGYTEIELGAAPTQRPESGGGQHGLHLCLESSGGLSLIPKHRPSSVCLSSPNPLIFKAISILFEETSQQFESGASGGRKGERGEGRGGGS